MMCSLKLFAYACEIRCMNICI